MSTLSTSFRVSELIRYRPLTLKPLSIAERTKFLTELRSEMHARGITDANRITAQADDISDVDLRTRINF